MIANILNRARNITTPVATDDDLIAALDAALAHSGAGEIAQGQVEIHCDQAFADGCVAVEMPVETQPEPVVEPVVPDGDADPTTDADAPTDPAPADAPVEEPVEEPVEQAPDAPHPFVKSAPGSFFAYTFRNVPVLVQ